MKRKFNRSAAMGAEIYRPGFHRDGATDITLDGSGKVYVTGYSFEDFGSLDYVTIRYTQTTDITQISNEIPEQFSLLQNYPNPFNPITHLEFALPAEISVQAEIFPKGPLRGDWEFISLKIYDILGKEVATLVNEKLSPGKYEVEFDGSGLTSGVYFYRLTAGELTDVKKMMLVK